MRAKVDWFNSIVGYGRATNAEGKRYHVHFSKIAADGCGFRTLAPGEEIEFRVVQEPGKELASAVDVKKSVAHAPIDPSVSRERFEKIPWTIEVEIAKDGKISFPQLAESHPRDYKGYPVEAFYLGHPGTFEKHNSFAVNMPWEEVQRGIYSDMAIYLTDEKGGILHDRAHPNFKPGHHVVTIQVIDNNVIVTATKIGLRTQDSRTVTNPEDMGVWLVNEVVYGGGLEIPEYEPDSKKAEQELKQKIQILIPAEFEWPTADNRKFAKAIARGILNVFLPAIRNL